MYLYYLRNNNFGDELSAKLVEKITGDSVKFSPMKKSNLIAVGSLFGDGSCLCASRADFKSFFKYNEFRFYHLLGRNIKPVLHIWGTGLHFLNYEYSDIRGAILKRKVKVHALRGKKTYNFFQYFGLLNTHQNIPPVLGDPGLLYDSLLDGNRKDIQYDIGIIPHYFDYKNGEIMVNKLSSVGIKTLLINVSNANSIAVIDEISQCDTILSSSLHGCIVADSLGIPNKHIMFSTFGYNLKQYLFKYQDYYSSYGIEYTSPMTINDVYERKLELVNFLKRTYNVSASQVLEKKKELLECFPFN